MCRCADSRQADHHVFAPRQSTSPAGAPSPAPGVRCRTPLRTAGRAPALQQLPMRLPAACQQASLAAADLLQACDRLAARPARLQQLQPSGALLSGMQPSQGASRDSRAQHTLLCRRVRMNALRACQATQPRVRRCLGRSPPAAAPAAALAPLCCPQRGGQAASCHSARITTRWSLPSHQRQRRRRAQPGSCCCTSRRAPSTRGPQGRSGDGTTCPGRPALACTLCLGGTW